MLAILLFSVCLIALVFLIWSDQERKSDITMLYHLHNDRTRPSNGHQYTINLLAANQNEHKKQLDELRSSTTLQACTQDEHSRAILDFDVRLDKIDAEIEKLHARADELDRVIRDSETGEKKRKASDRTDTDDLKVALISRFGSDYHPNEKMKAKLRDYDEMVELSSGRKKKRKAVR